MVYRGCVIKVEKDFAIVLTDEVEYVKIIKKDGLVVGQKIIFVKEDMYKENREDFMSIRLVAAVFMVLFLSISLLGKFHIFNNASAAAMVISVDINPSIQFEINKEEKVIKARAINQEGQKLLDRDFTGMTIEDSVHTVIENAKMKNYMTEEKNSILIATVPLKDDFKEKARKLEKEFVEIIKQDMELEKVNYIYIDGNKEDLKESKKQQLSIGKYEVYKKSKQKDQNITLEQIKAMKVEEIVNKKIGKLNIKRVKTKKESADKEIHRKRERDLKNTIEKNKLGKGHKKRKENELFKKNEKKEIKKSVKKHTGDKLERIKEHKKKILEELKKDKIKKEKIKKLKKLQKKMKRGTQKDK